MSRETPLRLRSVMLYQVYVRNHTEEGTFTALIKDLDRIKALGTCIVYLLPIHEIGVEKRKGKLGSPYAIKDYYSINPELGTMADFHALVEAIHARDMKVMMDIVFNHTSPDSVLINTHPKYFYRNEQGEFANRVGDWWDIKDFDYTKDKALYDALINVLLYWTAAGVDGFRFDVPSLLPLDFLEASRKAVKAVNPESIWLSESVHGGFLREIRNRGFVGLSESELFQVFDMAYDYDTHPTFEAYLQGKGSLKAYIAAIMDQEVIYPQNYIKLRNLENHDFGRIAGFLDNNADLIENWHAFNFFNKGATMVFGGGEYSATHHPDLFNKDVISRDNRDISDLIKTCAKIVKDPLFYEGVFNLSVPEQDVILGTYRKASQKALGVFNVSLSTGEITVPFKDGTYKNLLDGSTVVIKNQALTLTNKPIIIMN